LSKCYREIRHITIVAILASLWLAGCRSDRIPRELPVGNLDTPKPGEMAKGSLRISGWALSKEGIERVDVYLDGVLAVSSHTGVTRSDVQKVFPNDQKSETAGFDFQLDLAGKPPGTHDFTVQARSSDDAVRELCRFPITISP
jgi:hypothetical protein